MLVIAMRQIKMQSVQFVLSAQHALALIIINETVQNYFIYRE